MCLKAPVICLTPQKVIVGVICLTPKKVIMALPLNVQVNVKDPWCWGVSSTVLKRVAIAFYIIACIPAYCILHLVWQPNYHNRIMNDELSKDVRSQYTPSDFSKASKGYDDILYSQTINPKSKVTETSGVSTLRQVRTSPLKTVFCISALLSMNWRQQKRGYVTHAK